ncbi:MAG: hypothetical protein K8R31_13335 [Bacteroidales bacterium]|nr:hypothetical protein [Bacteroidales bacterium]
MNTINISVNIKSKSEIVNLVLFQKIYSTPDGIVNHWSTNSNSEFRLEIIIDEDDLSVNPSKITKSMSIITDEWDIADQMMLELYKTGSFSMQILKTHIDNNN